MSLSGYKSFYSIVRFLKKNIKLQYPFYVRRVNLPSNIDGDCSFINNKFEIRIKKNLPEYYAIDVLMHEAGHVLAWDKENNDHGQAWGRAYSIVYRKFLEWLDINP